MLGLVRIAIAGILSEASDCHIGCKQVSEGSHAVQGLAGLDVPWGGKNPHLCKQSVRINLELVALSDCHDATHSA